MKQQLYVPSIATRHRAAQRNIVTQSIQAAMYVAPPPPRHGAAATAAAVVWHVMSEHKHAKQNMASDMSVCVTDVPICLAP
jgi:hypothetical protein